MHRNVFQSYHNFGFLVVVVVVMTSPSGSAYSVTLNNALAYWTSELYQIPNPSPFIH